MEKQKETTYTVTAQGMTYTTTSLDKLYQVQSDLTR